MFFLPDTEACNSCMPNALFWQTSGDEQTSFYMCIHLACVVLLKLQDVKMSGYWAEEQKTEQKTAPEASWAQLWHRLTARYLT